MADMEKVINHFEDALSKIKPVDWWVFVRKDFLSDALTLLKEQQPIEPVYSHQHKHYVCPRCSLVLDEARDDYCPCCGVKIAWDESRYDSI